MAWEIESHHVDLAEMMHVTTFVEKTARTQSGEPARHLLQIRLGDHFRLDDEGQLIDADGHPVDLGKRQADKLLELNALHARARKFAQRHAAPIHQGKR